MIRSEGLNILQERKLIERLNQSGFEYTTGKLDNADEGRNVRKVSSIQKRR